MFFVFKKSLIKLAIVYCFLALGSLVMSVLAFTVAKKHSFISDGMGILLQQAYWPLGLILD